MSQNFDKYGEIIPDTPAQKFDKYGEIISEPPEPDLTRSRGQSRSSPDKSRTPPLRPQPTRTSPIPAIVLGGMAALCIVAVVLVALVSRSSQNAGVVDSPAGQETLATVVSVATPTTILPEIVDGGLSGGGGAVEPDTGAGDQVIPVVRIVSGPGRIQIQDVNLRAQPGSESQSITVLRRGVLVSILDESQTVESSTWVKVRAGDHEGWVNYRYILPIDQQALSYDRARVVNVAPLPLRVRSAPSDDASIIDRLSEGAEVDVIERAVIDGTEWYYIQVDQTQGWVSALYLAMI